MVCSSCSALPAHPGDRRGTRLGAAGFGQVAGQATPSPLPRGALALLAVLAVLCTIALLADEPGMGTEKLFHLPQRLGVVAVVLVEQRAPDARQRAADGLIRRVVAVLD